MELLKDNFKDLLKKGNGFKPILSSHKERSPIVPPRPPPIRPSVDAMSPDIEISPRVLNTSSTSTSTEFKLLNRHQRSLSAEIFPRASEFICDFPLNRGMHEKNPEEYLAAVNEACEGMSEAEKEKFLNKMNLMNVMFEREQAELEEQESKFLHLNERAMLSFRTSNQYTVRSLKRRRTIIGGARLSLSTSTLSLPQLYAEPFKGAERSCTSLIEQGRGRRTSLGTPMNPSTSTIPFKPPPYHLTASSNSNSNESLIGLSSPTSIEQKENKSKDSLSIPAERIDDFLLQTQKENAQLQSELHALKALVIQTKAALITETQTRQVLELQVAGHIGDKLRLQTELANSVKINENLQRLLDEYNESEVTNHQALGEDHQPHDPAQRLAQADEVIIRLGQEIQHIRDEIGTAKSSKATESQSDASMSSCTAVAPRVVLTVSLPSESTTVLSRSINNPPNTAKHSEQNIEISLNKEPNNHILLENQFQVLAVNESPSTSLPTSPRDKEMEKEGCVDVVDRTVSSSGGNTNHNMPFNSIVDPIQRLSLAATESTRLNQLHHVHDSNNQLVRSTAAPGPSVLLKSYTSTADRKNSTVINFEKGIVNKPHRVKFHPLCLWLDCALSGDIEPMEDLLVEGFGVDSCNEDGLTALHNSCCGGHPAIVKLLLAHGANPNVVDLDHWTPLHGAACFGQLDVVKLLLRYGASPHLENGDGDNPIDLCDDASTLSVLVAAEEMRCSQTELIALFDYKAE
eukprot:Ihof_evm3s135 gene=Ihof_evmTU3s135